MPGQSSKTFWNNAARHDAAWHIATGHQTQSDAFFESGRNEVEEFLRFAGLRLTRTDTLVEIGSGVGRMTGPLAELAGKVIASDVSGEMLKRAKVNLASMDNVEYVEVSGNGDLPLADESVDAVFSYITMQHVPTASAQEAYFAESLRILKPGGWVYIQFRRSGIYPRLIDWVGHLGHLMSGRNTLRRAWRGSRVKPSALLAFVSDVVTVDILPFGRRHIWALAHKR